MPDGTVFANASMRGYVFTIVNYQMYMLKSDGWKPNCNPVSQVGMQRFIVLKDYILRNEIEELMKQKVNT